MNKKNNLLVQLFFKKLKFTKIFLKRFYFEMYFSCYSNCLSIVKSLKNFQIKKLFLILFQIESFKVTQLLKKSINSYDVGKISVLKYFSFNFYKFNLFFHSLYISFYENFNFFTSSKCFNLLYSSDFFLKTLFDDFFLKYEFLKQNLLNFNHFSFFYFRNFFNRRSRSFILDVFFPNNNLIVSFFKKTLNKKLNLNLSLPFGLILYKLQVLGFLHNLKFRPIALVKYLFSEDFLIIKFFSSILYSLIIWFVKLNNFTNLNILVNLIKSSCFLTLSRKHKKSLSWSYILYTREVFYFKSISNFLIGFPLFTDFVFYKNLGFFYYIPFVLNEFFYLSL